MNGAAAYDVANFTLADVVNAQQTENPQPGVLLVPPWYAARSLSLRVGPSTLPSEIALAYRIGPTGAPVPLRVGDSASLYGTTAGVYACFWFGPGIQLASNSLSQWTGGFGLLLDTLSPAQLAQAIQFFLGL